MSKHILYHSPTGTYMYAHSEDERDALIDSFNGDKVFDVTEQAAHVRLAELQLGAFDPDANSRSNETAIHKTDTGWHSATEIAAGKQQQQASYFCKLRAIVGYVQNASDVTVTIFQDDATRTYHISVGKRRYWGDSFEEAIDNAYADAPEENKP